MNIEQNIDKLYKTSELIKLDAQFFTALAAENPETHARLLAARQDPAALSELDESRLIIEIAPYLDQFLGQLFGIEGDWQSLSTTQKSYIPFYDVRRQFVQRRAAKAFSVDEVLAFDVLTLEAEMTQLLGQAWSEESFVQKLLTWLSDEEKYKSEIDLSLRYTAYALHHPTGKEKHQNSCLFYIPRKIDPAHLVQTCEVNGALASPHLHGREGFSLTDQGMDTKHALGQVHYCILCHGQGKDSCSKGLKDKTTGAYQKTVHGITQAGCPLEEKISQMHQVKGEGGVMSALAVIAIDNPLCAATGHRICNDCMKACIYQKQDPVDIPQVETRILKDVLSLPWGFEIYSLLTRWNPLNFVRPYPREKTGKRVVVVGMGPAGMNLAHHLLNDGHEVIAIDGAKIEPLPQDILTQPIKDISILHEDLADRISWGFGGVAEYGITVRWDKNYLKILRLLIERRDSCRIIGGVRMGGTLTFAQSFEELGADHIALCGGAGAPTVIDIPGNLARGVRQASDFLMALQLTGAAKKDSIANLQLRLPVIVIGGGLTAIDTATESLAYYAVQVEKFLTRFEALNTDLNLTPEEKIIADEWLNDARALRQLQGIERTKYLQSRGGATICYRRSLQEAPSYTLNHEEVAKALEEGIFLRPNLTPKSINTDEFGHAETVSFSNADGALVTLPARAILVAAGTQPNIVLAAEEGLTLDGKYFAAIDEDGQPVTPEKISKPHEIHVLAHRYPSLSSRTSAAQIRDLVLGSTASKSEIPQQVRDDTIGITGLASNTDNPKFISYFGDMHPSFAGNVVKAMGGAKQSYPILTQLLSKLPQTKKPSLDDITKSLSPTVHAVNRLTPTIVEVVLHAPYAAKNFQPGQFYRLQNFEITADVIQGTRLAMEGLAMTGAWVDLEKNLIAVIALEMGGSSNLCARLKVGEPVILMGPTGTPTEIPKNKTVMLIGGGLGNAVLFSIGAAMRAAGCRVLYFAGYKKAADRYHTAKIEAAADLVVWCCDEAGLTKNRPQDQVIESQNIIEAMVTYAATVLSSRTSAAQIRDRVLGSARRKSEIPDQVRDDNEESGEMIPLSDIDHIIAIGSDRMMEAVAKARHSVLKPYLTKNPEAVGSINSPMQCMMKKICGQCLQTHIDPETGHRQVIFSCDNQDQPLDHVDFQGLHDRLGQNTVQEKMTRKWLEKLLA